MSYRAHSRVPGKPRWSAVGRPALRLTRLLGPVDGGHEEVAARPEARITISLASLAWPMTGPPTNTCWPADSALVAACLACRRTTVVLTRSQVQVVPSWA